MEELHSFLRSEGYITLEAGVSPTYYSATTAKAVARWQKDHGVLSAEKPGDFGHLSRQAYLSMLVGLSLAFTPNAVQASRQ